MRVVIVINIPAPYRIPIFEKLSEYLGNDFLVIFAARSEPNRAWNIKELKFNHLFLNENITEKKDGFNYVHNNIDVIQHLKLYNPDVIITTGFNPTHLYAWLYAKLFRKKHVTMTDGTMTTEKHLSWLHKFIRKIVFSTSHAHIGASKSTIFLYESYHIPRRKIFQSHLCVDNGRFYNNLEFAQRTYDLMFSGNFIDIKRPLFFAEIVQKVSKTVKNLSVLIIGDGPLKNEFLSKMDTTGIDYTYPGYIEQKDLPSYYSKTKLFLFTTKHDAWGVVANEALASGTPVLVSPFAGVANDLVIDNYNGYILNDDSDIWAQYIIELLQNSKKWQHLSLNATDSVKQFTFEHAAMGILNACNYAYTNTKE